MNWNPRSIRNFFLSASVDGKETRVETGPRAKDGGMNATFYVRDKGQVTSAVSVWCSYRYGKLIIEVELPEDARVSPINGRKFTIERER